MWHKQIINICVVKLSISVYGWKGKWSRDIEGFGVTLPPENKKIKRPQVAGSEICGKFYS